MFSYNLDHLKALEAESIDILRELVSLCENPVLLFSGGKDSIVTSHLARKAFYPAPIPFPLLHIDTEHNFPETISFRDHWVKMLGAKLIVRSVQQSIDAGRVTEEKGIHASRNVLQTVTLLDAIKELRLEELVGMKRRQGLKKDFFHIAMNSGNGTQRIKDRSFGICLMQEKVLLNIFAFSLLATGPSWIYGSIFFMKKLKYLLFIIHIKEKLFSAMDSFLLLQNSSSSHRMKGRKKGQFVSGLLET